MKAGDAALTSGLHVKLFRGGFVGGGRPTPPPVTTSAKPPPDTTPSGFKDLPY